MHAQICKNCGTRNTPFWRKDKNDGRPLCNACGLYFAKNDMQRPKVLWKEGGHGGGGGGGGGEGDEELEMQGVQWEGGGRGRAAVSLIQMRRLKK